MCWWSADTKSLLAANLFPLNPGFLQVVKPTDSSASWVGKVHPLDRDSVAKFFDRLTSADVGSFIEYRLLTKDEDSIWVRQWISHFDSSRNVASGALAEIEEVRWLRRESIHISEREKNRIGQELHDDLCQVLAGLGCLLRVLENRVASRVPEEVPNLREINRQMVEAMERTRALTHGLFPARLKTLSIRDAIQELATQLKTRFRVQVVIGFHGSIPVHHSDSILNVYRIAQEAASNAIRHGGATRIEFEFRKRDSMMEMTINDNGGGYTKPGDGAGIGMEIMRNRARMLGGDMTVASQPGKGVKINVSYQAKP